MPSVGASRESASTRTAWRPFARRRRNPTVGGSHTLRFETMRFPSMSTTCWRDIFSPLSRSNAYSPSSGTSNVPTSATSARSSFALPAFVVTSTERPSAAPPSRSSFTSCVQGLKSTRAYECQWSPQPRVETMNGTDAWVLTWTRRRGRLRIFSAPSWNCPRPYSLSPSGESNATPFPKTSFSERIAFPPDTKVTSPVFLSTFATSPPPDTETTPFISSRFNCAEKPSTNTNSGLSASPRVTRSPPAADNENETAPRPVSTRRGEADAFTDTPAAMKDAAAKRWIPFISAPCQSILVSSENSARSSRGRGTPRRRP